MRIIKSLMCFCCLLVLSGCDMGFQAMEAGQYGIVFNALPRWMGGGVRPKVLQEGEMELIFPWQTLTVYDATQQTISWGSSNTGDSQHEDYVETRSVDGNEVGLAIEVQYRVDPKMLAHILQKVGDMSRIRMLIGAVARADIRTHMNVLTTSEFFDQAKRQTAVKRVEYAMNTRLKEEGIIVDRVRFIDYKFERAGALGQAADDSYQKQIDETQATIQQTEQEAKKRSALIQEKGREYEAAEGERKKVVAHVKGYARQAKIRGDAYLEQKKNKAAQIETAGMNEVEGMKKRIEALSGPGGEALLRLEIAKQLVKAKPRFMLLNSKSGKNGAVEVNRIDTNQLIKQMGMFAVAKEALETEPVPSPAKSKTNKSAKPN